MLGNIHRGKFQRTGGGSAVSITPLLAVTNYHVVKGNTVVANLKESDDDLIFWKVIKIDKSKDLAVISQSTKKFPASNKIRSYKTLKVGEKVFAIGSPKGLENTLSEGIISGIRKVNGRTLIQTTTPITFGSSGGALYDMKGNLVGITTEGVGEANLNFAVSVDDVLSLGVDFIK